MKSWIYICLVAASVAIATPTTALADCCLPEHVQNQNGVAFISGGVGDEEVDALSAMSSNYSLKLVFAEKASGSFVADVHVLIEDAKGTQLIDMASAGPWFLAALKPGRYRLKLGGMGVEKKYSITIQRGRQTQMVIHWP